MLLKVVVSTMKFLILSVLLSYSCLVSCNQQKYKVEHRTPGHFWRDFYGFIPDDALQGSRGRYIGQVLSGHKNVLVPAQVNKNSLYATYTYEGKFYSTKDFKILGTTDANQFEWISSNIDNVKQLSYDRYLVPGGYDDGFPLFIGKSLEGDFIGKVTINPVWAGLVYPDDNNRHHHDHEFYVLAYRQL